jgi:hypothetical protein
MIIKKKIENHVIQDVASPAKARIAAWVVGQPPLAFEAISTLSHYKL